MVFMTFFIELDLVNTKIYPPKGFFFFLGVLT